MSIEAGSEISGAAQAGAEELHIQPDGFLVELTLDWIVKRASENVHRFLGQSHVSLIEEPLSRFVQAQPLHDLRNLFSRLSGTTGVARAYQARLTDDGRRFDLAFQLSDGRVLLEGVASPDEGLGEKIGSVVGLADGLAGAGADRLPELAARRMRALTGFDSVTFVPASGEACAESRRPGISAQRRSAALLRPGERSRLIADVRGEPVPIFPRSERDMAPRAALLRSPRAAERGQLLADGIAATMRVPVRLDGVLMGSFECDHCSAMKPRLELHAAAELFAQMFAMRLRIAGLAG